MISGPDRSRLCSHGLLEQMLNSEALDLLLAEYAVGSLPQPAEVLVQSHLELDTCNRLWIADLKVLGGVLNDDAPVSEQGPLAIAPERLSDDIESVLPSASEPAADRADGVLPKALRQYIGCDEAEIAWRFRIPGLREFPVESAEGCTASLLKISPGAAMPSHTHGGREITLVLKGAFSDHTGRYARGDIAIADEDVDHKPIADDGEECICFAVSEASLKLTGPIGKYISRIAGQ